MLYSKETKPDIPLRENIILKMFKKQTIHISERNIDENTIKVLKRGERYKWFKLDICIDNSDQTRVDMIYWMLDILPEFEIKRIGVIKGDNELINGLKQLPIFKDKEDPFKVLEF